MYPATPTAQENTTPFVSATENGTGSHRTSAGDLLLITS